MIDKQHQRRILIGLIILSIGGNVLLLSRKPSEQSSTGTDQPSPASRSEHRSRPQPSSSDRQRTASLRQELRRHDPANHYDRLTQESRAVPREYFDLLLASTKYRKLRSITSNGTARLFHGSGLTDNSPALSPLVAEVLRLSPREWKAFNSEIARVSKVLAERAQEHQEIVQGEEGRIIHRIPIEVARSDDLREAFIEFAMETIGKERAGVVPDLLAHDPYLRFDDGVVEVSLVNDGRTLDRDVTVVQTDGTRRTERRRDVEYGRYMKLLREEQEVAVQEIIRNQERDRKAWKEMNK